MGTWQKEGFEYQQLEDDGGGGIAGGGGIVVDDHECLIRVEGDNESMGSSPSRSYKGSRLSISSHGVVQQALKSPTKTTYVALAVLACYRNKKLYFNLA